MPLYEHVYLARQDLSAQQIEELTAQYKGVIEQMGGKVAKTEYWGVKTLTYRMRKNRKGHYVMFWVGFLFPILWIVGALVGPTPNAAARTSGAV